MAKHTAKSVRAQAAYTRAELLDGAAAFGVRPEVVAGALKLAGKEEMTRSEAQQAIKRFQERKV